MATDNKRILSMFSLPDIKRMNDEAVKRYKEEQAMDLTKANILANKVCNEEGCGNQATTYYDCYDIFSEYPKHRIFLCDEHAGNGDWTEELFLCAVCGRFMKRYYSYEFYSHCTDEGETLCLKCYLEREIDNPDNWLQDASEVTWERVWEAKHLIAGESTYWRDKLDFYGNVEVESSTGELITGSTSTSSKADSLRELQELVADAVSQHGKAILILDGVYQFATSIGVYTRKG